MLRRLGQVRVYLHGIRDQQGNRANERARPPVLKAVNWEMNSRKQAKEHRSASLGRQEGLLATAAEREHWSKTFLLKQTKASGGGPRGHRQAPRFAQKLKNGSENLFVDKEATLPTQQPTSDWQHLNKWHSGNNSSSASTKDGGFYCSQSDVRKTSPLTLKSQQMTTMRLRETDSVMNERVLHDLSGKV